MSGTLALAIETSNPSADAGCGVAIGRLDAGKIELLGVEGLRRTDRHSDDLMPAIERLTSEAGVAQGDVELVCVSAGPGGYTGVRIAIVTAQVIAECAGGRCVGVPTEVVVARRVDGGRAFGVCLASKGESAFVRVFDARGAPVGAGRVMDAEALSALEIDLLVADRFLPAAMRRAALDAGMEIRPPRFDPVAVLEAGSSMTPVDPVALRAIYPREPDAVTQWRRLHGGDGGGILLDKS